MIELTFRRGERGLAIVDGARARLNALAGFLMAEVKDATDALRLRRGIADALTGGRSFEEGGNAFTVVVNGASAVVTFDIDDAIQPSHIPAQALLSALLAWEEYLTKGRPTKWSWA